MYRHPFYYITGTKKEPDASGKVGEQSSRARATSDSIISIADLLNLVKGDAEKYIPKFSISSDSDGKTLTNEQSEYFKDSKMCDDDGNPVKDDIITYTVDYTYGVYYCYTPTE